MSKIELTTEILDKHTEAEIIEHLTKTMGGVVQNYKVAFQSGRSDAIWGSFGDIMLVYDFLREMKRRNDARDAMKES